MLLRSAILLRAFMLWALLIGQAVMIASFSTGVGFEAWSAGPDAPAIIGVILAVSGLVGMVGEWVFRACFERDETAAG